MPWRGLVAYLLMGAAVGWLVGLALSPTVSAVLTALTALVTSTLAAAAGVKVKDQDVTAVKVNAWPVASLLVGMAIAASAAVPVREGQMLVPRGARVTKSASTDSGSGKSPATKGGLYGGPAPSACARVERAGGPALVRAFASANDPVFEELGRQVSDTIALDAMRRVLCPKQ